MKTSLIEKNLEEKPCLKMFHLLKIQENLLAIMSLFMVGIIIYRIETRILS